MRCYAGIALVALASLCNICNAVDHLVPIRRSLPRIAKRDEASALKPRGQVELLYTHPWSSNVATAVVFTAHQDRNILMLEELDQLMEAVRCIPGQIQLKLWSKYAYEGAEMEWKDQKNFIAIASHEGCNPDYQRTAYLVSEARFNDEYLTVTLFVNEISWIHVGRGMKIKYGQTHEDNYVASRLLRRSEHKAEQKDPNNATVTFSRQLGPRENLNSVEVGDSEAKLSDKTFNFTCIDCGFEAEFDIGGEFDIDFNEGLFPAFLDKVAAAAKINDADGSKVKSRDIMDDVKGAFNKGVEGVQDTANKVRKGAEDFFGKVKDGVKKDVDDAITKVKDTFEDIGDTAVAIGDGVNDIFTARNITTIKKASMFLNVKKFDAKVAIETVATGEIPLFGFTRDLTQKAFLSPYQVPGIINIGPQAGIMFEVKADIKAELNFTTGMEVKIPNNATAGVDFRKKEKLNVSGWDGTTVTRLPPTLNGGELNLNVVAGLAPYIELGVTIGDGISVGLEATVNCKEATDSDFETYDTIQISGTYDISLQPESNIDILGHIKPPIAVAPSKNTTSLPSAVSAVLNSDFDKLFSKTEDLFKSKCVIIGKGGEFVEDLKSIAPKIDYDGLAKYVKDNGKAPESLNVTNVQNGEGFKSLPADVQQVITKKADDEKAAEEKKKSGGNRLHPHGALIVTVGVMVLFGLLCI